jgi:hypothetical protein
VSTNKAFQEVVVLYDYLMSILRVVECSGPTVPSRPDQFRNYTVSLSPDEQGTSRESAPLEIEYNKGWLETTLLGASINKIAPECAKHV